MIKVKGQNLAVETVFIFGLGILLAVGVIEAFNIIKYDALENFEQDEAQRVISKVNNAFLILKNTDEPTQYSNASYDLELSDTIGGSEYSVSADNKLLTVSGNEEYSKNLSGFSNYRLTGSVSGGDITIFKQEKQLEIRNR